MPDKSKKKKKITVAIVIMTMSIFVPKYCILGEIKLSYFDANYGNNSSDQLLPRCDVTEGLMTGI